MNSRARPVRTVGRPMLYETERRRLRVSYDLVERLDGRVRHSDSVESLCPVSLAGACKYAAEQGDQNRPVAHAPVIGGKAGIVGELRLSKCVAKLAKQAVIASRDHEVAVGSAEGLVGNNLGDS